MLFINATVFTGDSFLPNTSVLVEEGHIKAIGPDLATGDGIDILDLQGDYLVPGLIDLQLYGGATEFLNAEPTPETVRHIWKSHALNGTTTLLPTLHSTHLAEMQQATSAVRVVRDEMPLNVPGIHLEGPYFNPIKKGAHRAKYVRVPAEGELETLFSHHADAISILTLAPEMLSPDQLTLLYGLAKASGTLLSLGHSNATYQQAMAAFGDGSDTDRFLLATHLYNAMRGFESREPGTVGAIFDHPTVISSIVTDGYHCAPAAIRMAHRQLGPDRLFLISDALFANPPRANFALETFVVHFEPGSGEPGSPLHGRYVNEQGTLAGTAITVLDCVRFCVQEVGLPLTDALRMATVTPANVIGLGDQIGCISPGYVANLVRLDKGLVQQGVWVDGNALA
ncbi:N-acetylglucosamine-6-phosphate deacetylase [Fibrella forsythiae]|uniref:N-acetylglucosamine-6-phosphate deacetylase n=1 Tax=Fibrella forsythiae TaxID=2817061 RepID=A0ABS3JF91_9BACT|nr:N-acetylglucosamine-6-phosphate deacetylase [Fibrella forsythiae]MBO0948666.1 N-acetylglucosamine-6-phosphate deacetylase [Fibrella forsythiae]